MANPGTESFFGGFAEGLGSGLLQREQMKAQKQARESEQKMELWKLIYSNPDIPDATKMQFGKMVFQQPAQEGPIAKIKGAFGKGPKKQQPPSASDIFQKLQDAMSQQGGDQAPPSPTPPLPSVGGGAAASPSPSPATAATPTAIPNLPGVKQGPGGMPYDPGMTGGPSGIPPLPDLSTARGRETQQYLQETQGVTDIQTRAAIDREKKLLDYRLAEINKASLDPQEKKIATVEAITGRTLPAGARPETLDQTAADLFQKYQSGQIDKAHFDKGVESLKELRAAAQKPPVQSVGQQQMDDWLKKHPGRGPSDYAIAMKKLVPNFNYFLQSGEGVRGPTQEGPSALSNLKPADKATVQAILDGRMTPPQGYALRSPYWQRIMPYVYAADPKWSVQRAQIRKAFTSGPDAKNIGALNTAAVHLNTLQGAADALQNGNFRPGNWAYNEFKKAFGNAAPTNFDGIKNAVAGEMANALKGSATDVEIANVQRGIEAQNTPAQLSGFINTQLHILHQKLETYNERFHQQIPGDTSYSPILPQAQAVFQKHGVSEPAAGQGLPPVPKPRTGADPLGIY